MGVVVKLMKQKVNILILVISILILITVGILIFLNLRPKPAGILVRSNPASSIFINEAFIGKTPYTGTLNPGQVTVKMVPDSFEQALLPFETTITLTAGIQTVIRREFGETEETSSGDVISFDSTPGGETSLIVVSTPDNSQVSVDDIARGFAPYKTSDIAPGQHKITIQAPGYDDRTMTLNIEKNYRLTVFAKLAPTKAEEITNTPAPFIGMFIEILESPTGYVRVRSEPGSGGEEIAEVGQGSKFPLLEKDEVTGWYKIQYQEPRAGLPSGITGWISFEYSRVIDEAGNEVVF